MHRVFLEQVEILPCSALDRLWKGIEGFPETAGGPMHLEVFQTPFCFFIKSFVDEKIQFAGF